MGQKLLSRFSVPIAPQTPMTRACIVGRCSAAVDRHGRVSEEGLHANSIGAIVKRACRTAGYNAKEFAGHSLGTGLATQAASNGVPERLIMRQTRHCSVTTLRRYIR
ncbi:MAG: hypothetical protein WB762_19960 [Candidatus Sulfotelmatobacter sp.]